MSANAYSSFYHLARSHSEAVRRVYQRHDSTLTCRLQEMYLSRLHSETISSNVKSFILVRLPRSGCSPQHTSTNSYSMKQSVLLVDSKRKSEKILLKELILLFQWRLVSVANNALYYEISRECEIKSVLHDNHVDCFSLLFKLF